MCKCLSPSSPLYVCVSVCVCVFGQSDQLVVCVCVCVSLVSSCALIQSVLIDISSLKDSVSSEWSSILFCSIKGIRASRAADRLPVDTHTHTRAHTYTHAHTRCDEHWNPSLSSDRFSCFTLKKNCPLKSNSNIKAFLFITCEGRNTLNQFPEAIMEFKLPFNVYLKLTSICQ